MGYRFAPLALVGITLVAVAACDHSRPTGPDGSSQGPAAVATAPAEESVDIGGKLYTVPVPEAKKAVNRERTVADPIVIPECRLTALHKEDVPAQREGVLWVIGTEAKEGEDVPPDRLIVREGKKYRRLERGDEVKKDQMLALLDDQLARADLLIKQAKIVVAQKDALTSEATRDEAKERYTTQLRLQEKGATSAEEVRGAKLTWTKFLLETESKREAVNQAKAEAEQAQKIVDQHVVRSSIDGRVKDIFKEIGEAVKATPSFEPLFQLYDPSTLRAMGQVDLQYVGQLRTGMKAVVEASQPQGQAKTWRGHLQQINAVAAGKGKGRSLVVSGSDDATVRVWDRDSTSRGELFIFHHHSPVRAVACTPKDAAASWCVSATADGKAFVWDLDNLSDKPLHVLEDANGHHGAITCVAFSPDGKWCATGGEDREICLWDAGAGKLAYRLPTRHGGPITSVQFTPQSQLVSTAKDYTLRVWELGERGGRQVGEPFGSRSGEVARLGVSSDGKQFLFDRGKTMQVLSLPRG